MISSLAWNEYLAIKPLNSIYGSLISILARLHRSSLPSSHRLHVYLRLTITQWLKYGPFFWSWCYQIWCFMNWWHTKSRLLWISETSIRLFLFAEWANSNWNRQQLMLTKLYVRLFWTLELEVAWLQVLSILEWGSLTMTSLVSSNQQLSYSLFLLLSSSHWNVPPAGTSSGSTWFPGNASTASVLDSATSDKTEVPSIIGECTLRLCSGKSGGVTEHPFRRPLFRLEDTFPDPGDPFRVWPGWTRTAFELSGRTMANCLAGSGDLSVWVQTSFRNGWKTHTNSQIRDFADHPQILSSMNVYMETYIEHSQHNTMTYMGNQRFIV